MADTLARVYISGEAGSLAHELRDVLTVGRWLNDELPKTRCNPFTDVPEVDASRPDLPELLHDLQPTALVHNAALVMSHRCDDSPYQAFENNVLTTYRIAESYKPGMYVVYFSTVAIYDPKAPRPITEESNVAPATYYGQTKWWSEQMLREMIEPDDLLIIRSGYVYGGGARDRASVLTDAVRQAMFGGPKVDARMDPNKYKDLVHINEAMRNVANLMEQRRTGVYNVFSGVSYIYHAVVSAMELHDLNTNIQFYPELDYHGDLTFDIEKLQRAVTRWVPIGLDDGIEMTKAKLLEDRACGLK
jgi:nucleoside-diphosphate-sugar epimerase